MSATPYELLSSITEEYVNNVSTKYPQAYHDSSPEITAANYIRMLRLAPAFLKLIKASMYISTQCLDGVSFSYLTTSPSHLSSDSCTYKTLNDNNEIIDTTINSEIIEKIHNLFMSWEQLSKSTIATHTH